MITATCQIRDGIPYPYSREDHERLKRLCNNQLVTGKFVGSRKPRSVQQNKWLHAIFRMVADNTSNPDWNTPEKVKRNVKMAMKFFKDDVIVNGNKVFFELRSFSFSEMDHVEACRVYDHAKEVCAEFLKVPVDDLEPNAKRYL